MNRAERTVLWEAEELAVMDALHDRWPCPTFTVAWELAGPENRNRNFVAPRYQQLARRVLRRLEAHGRAGARQTSSGWLYVPLDVADAVEWMDADLLIARRRTKPGFRLAGMDHAPQDMIDHAIGVLNRIHQADPAVMPSLIGYRVNCNETVADDPTVQVGQRPGGGFEVGLLGVLNGIFGTQPGSHAGWIAAHYDDGDRRLTHFARLEAPDPQR